MLLRRIEIRDFRKLSHVVIDGLSDGLNVLVGDNEAGKSTLLAALRAVLFERHRVGGRIAAAMLPHGQEVRPEITIDFELNGVPWRLRKSFNQRPEAELTGGGKKITGDAVEERMAELLGFQAPGNRGSKPEEHQGVYGLLWVEQGLAHTPLNIGAGQGTLAAALESEVGLVLGGERGRALLAKAETRRESFWDKRERPRGTYRVAQDEAVTLEQDRAELEARLRRHDEQVAALAVKAEALARYSREDRLARAGRAVEAARGAADRAGQLAATLHELGVALARAAVDRDTATERLAVRRALDAKVQVDRERAATTSVEAELAAAVVARVEAAAKSAAERAAVARGRRDHAEEAVQAIERRLGRQKARQARAAALARLAEAEAVASRQGDALAQAAAITVGRKEMADLDRLAAACEQARAKRDAAGVQIGFAPLADGAVMLDGVPHPAGVPLLLARDAVLDLAGFGRLTVRPGGGVEALAQGVEAAGRLLADRLRQLGQSSCAEAATAFGRKRDAEAEAAAQARVFAVLAPAGLEPLRLAAGTLGSEVEGDAEPSRPVTDQDLAAVRRERQSLQAAEREAEAEAVKRRSERETAGHEAAVLAERAAAAARDHAAGIRALADARGLAGDASLEARLAETERACAWAGDAAAAARRALEAADPDTAALELRRAEAAEAAIRADIETLTREKRDLEVELRTLGKDGLGERLAEADGRLTLLRRQAGTRALEAQASLLLHKTLAQAQTETRDRWLGPVRDRVRPYLKLIQPDSEIVLNEKTFSIEHLVRGGVSEPFDSLSVGAREQVAVITRLALADILRASGQPSAVILDDALVNTDETRLDRMHLVLQKAAETLQVIVLTCRERDFYGLGAPIRRL